MDFQAEPVDINNVMEPSLGVESGMPFAVNMAEEAKIAVEDVVFRDVSMDTINESTLADVEQVVNQVQQAVEIPFFLVVSTAVLGIVILIVALRRWRRLSAATKTVSSVTSTSSSTLDAIPEASTEEVEAKVEVVEEIVAPTEPADVPAALNAAAADDVNVAEDTPVDAIEAIVAAVEANVDLIDFTAEVIVDAVPTPTDVAAADVVDKEIAAADVAEAVVEPAVAEDAEAVAEPAAVADVVAEEGADAVVADFVDSRCTSGIEVVAAPLETRI
jgi:hypothetical protein